jgi:hypothetical protein
VDLAPACGGTITIPKREVATFAEDEDWADEYAVLTPQQEPATEEAPPAFGTTCRRPSAPRAGPAPRSSGDAAQLEPWVWARGLSAERVAELTPVRDRLLELRALGPTPAECVPPRPPRRSAPAAPPSPPPRPRSEGVRRPTSGARLLALREGRPPGRAPDRDHATGWAKLSLPRHEREGSSRRTGRPARQAGRVWLAAGAPRPHVHFDGLATVTVRAPSARARTRSRRSAFVKKPARRR